VLSGTYPNPGADATLATQAELDAAVVSFSAVPGTYVEFASDITVSATSDVTANPIVTAGSFTPNGTDKFWVEFSCVAVATGASTGAAVIVVLYDNGTIVSPSRIGQVTTPAASSMIAPVFNRVQVAPTNAAHVYSARAYRVTANGTMFAAAGSNMNPGHIVVLKAN
jgi:hypothetical protein